MKRIVSLALVLCLLLTVCGCGKGESKPTQPTQPTQPTETPIPTTDNVMIDTTGMTNAQKAVVLTAESYFLRGKRAQYDQTKFTKGTVRSVGRRTTGERKPEDLTAQNFGYTDCSSFVFDVYWAALGMDFSEGPTKRNTKSFMTNPHVVLSEQVEGQGWTAEIKAQKAKELQAALQPGDIIVYRKKGNGAGHAMLYVGNDRILHSAGGDFNFTETYEKNGTYCDDKVSELLLTAGGVRYLMSAHSYVIMRPLAKFEGEIPTDTVARFGDMRGIMAEKLASHTYGQSVSLGGEVTFTFHIENRSTAEKTLTVTDTVPQYTTYVSGAETVSGNTLSWKVTVPAGGSKDVSYTVKVTEDAAALGKYVQSESRISGVAVNCREIYIQNTLSGEQQTALVEALNKQMKGKLGGVALADAAYKAIGITVLDGLTTETLEADLVENWSDAEPGYDFREDSAYRYMNPPRMYGGMHFVEKVANESYRTRLLAMANLVVGDLIVADGEVYMFTGEKLVDLDKKEENDAIICEVISGYYTFVVLRPSFGA